MTHTQAVTQITQDPTIRTVTADTLNVREGPGMEFPTVSGDGCGYLRKGDDVIVLKKRGAWWYVAFGHCFGWVHSDWIE